MAAAEFNKNAQKHTEEDALNSFKQILECAISDTDCNYMGTALAKLGLYKDWCKEQYERFPHMAKEFGEIHNKALQVFESKLVEKGLVNKTNSHITTFTLSNAHGWRTKTDNEVTGKNGKDLFENIDEKALDAKIAALMGKMGK